MRLKGLLLLLRGTWELSQDGIDELTAERDTVHEHTLGGLASRFKEKFGGEAQQVERHAHAIDDIVHRRNDLTHHLFDRLSWTAADIEEACTRLDREHEEAAPLAHWVRDLLQAQGRSNSEIFAQIASELGQRRFRAPAYTERQIRRVIYG